MANILLAEDDASMRQFLKSALEQAGHSVCAKSDGLKALGEIQSKPLAYDLLLSDIVMPCMDGITLSRKAVEICPKLKIMFITGFSGMAAMDSTKLAPVVTKPFHLKDLVKRVDEILSPR